MLQQQLQRDFNAWLSIAKVERHVQRPRGQCLDTVRRVAAQKQHVAGTHDYLGLGWPHLRVGEVAQADPPRCLRAIELPAFFAGEVDD